MFLVSPVSRNVSMLLRMLTITRSRGGTRSYYVTSLKGCLTAKDNEVWLCYGAGLPLHSKFSRVLFIALQELSWMQGWKGVNFDGLSPAELGKAVGNSWPLPVATKLIKVPWLEHDGTEAVKGTDSIQCVFVFMIPDALKGIESSCLLVKGLNGYRWCWLYS